MREVDNVMTMPYGNVKEMLIPSPFGVGRDVGCGRDQGIKGTMM
jgi:hypothetical protein